MLSLCASVTIVGRTNGSIFEYILRTRSPGLRNGPSSQSYALSYARQARMSSTMSRRVSTGIPSGVLRSNLAIFPDGVGGSRICHSSKSRGIFVGRPCEVFGNLSSYLASVFDDRPTQPPHYRWVTRLGHVMITVRRSTDFHLGKSPTHLSTGNVSLDC